MDTMESSIDIQKQQKNVESNDKEKDIYFIIINPSCENQKNFNNLKFKSEITPQIIYNKIIEKENGPIIGYKVYKINIKAIDKNRKANQSINNKIEYEIGNDFYIISFSVKENSFVYDIELIKSNIFYDIVKENIDQNIIPLYNKLDIFEEALKGNNEKNKIENLYQETIQLYNLVF